VLDALLEAGSSAMNTPVEIEFAVNLGVAPGEPAEFGFLQVRPLAPLRESEGLELGELPPEQLLCRSTKVLGNGRIEGIKDLVVVDFRRFERARSAESARAVGRVNARLLGEDTPYILIGVGRWGSRDPWLGIPVGWDDVAGSAVIVETGLRDIAVTPSQGTHFFQNLTSFNVGYFTVNPDQGDGLLDWDWLASLPAVSEEHHVRHIRLEEPLLVQMNGKSNEGQIVKPDAPA
jgi:hypothetical protein